MVCATGGHRQKAEEYVCLVQGVQKRFICFYCLLGEYAEHFRHVVLLSDFLEQFNYRNANASIFKHTIDQLTQQINLYPQHLQAKVDSQQQDRQLFHQKHKELLTAYQSATQDMDA